jgi:hypothetical protein
VSAQDRHNSPSSLSNSAREVIERARDTLGACHIVEEGPNARWVGDSLDGYFEEDLRCRADCPVCEAKRALDVFLGVSS